VRRGAGFFAVCEVWALSAFSAFAVFADFAVLTVLSAFADLAEPDDLADLAGFTDASVAAVSAVLIFSELLRTGRFMVDGDLYKRSKYPAQPPEKRNLLDRKNICFLRESQDYDLIFSDRLSEALMDDFRALLPTYEFFLRALESSRREA